ncbi:hypothetical protein RchiOBHm_Chr0c23g0500781 [Rosa chinensis]|uniref:Uncharacterized protein n=1 Tax=Rosa chinensis TaxID=74649 RepID=A0A2P6SQF2_ROSCH|nr:hypothetical protein RchiOBHm_Chr0c23g0500781 [Rosa chinensis]
MDVQEMIVGEWVLVAEVEKEEEVVVVEEEEEEEVVVHVESKSFLNATWPLVLSHETINSDVCS